jgi:hypothetical protein
MKKSLHSSLYKRIQNDRKQSGSILMNSNNVCVNIYMCVLGVTIYFFASISTTI